MVTDRDLRRVGLYARQPARRRQQALCLQDMPLEALNWLATQATGDDAAATIESWLEDGSWRDRWSREVTRQQAHAVEVMDPERLDDMVAARVFGDRRSVDQVAIEFGLSRQQVERIVMRGGISRGLDDDAIQQVIQPRRGRTTSRLGRSAASDAVEQQPRPRQEIEQWFAREGRRPPSHVVEVLCGRESTREVLRGK